MEAIAIGNNVTSIGKNAFSNCESLVYIVVAPGNTVYDSRDKCHAIIETATNTLICGSRTFTIPNSVTSIGDYAFNGRKSRTSITIPNSVTSIGMMAFGNCSLLQEITIPDSIMSIGWGAFSGCSSLKKITIPNSVTSIGKMAFSDCAYLTSIVVAEDNTVYDSRDNCNAIIKTDTNAIICGCQNTTIPNSITSIESSAFSGCSSLTSITIPDSVKSIGSHAFSGCSSLTSITIPDGVESIGLCAFGKDAYSWGSSSLNTICYDSTIAQWKKIELTDGWNNDISTKVVHCTDGDVEI